MHLYRFLIPMALVAAISCGSGERKPDSYSSTHLTHHDKWPNPAKTFTDFAYNGKSLDGIDAENEVIVADDVAEDAIKTYYSSPYKRNIRRISRNSEEFRQLEKKFELAKLSK